MKLKLQIWTVTVGKRRGERWIVIWVYKSERKKNGKSIFITSKTWPFLRWKKTRVKKSSYKKVN